MFVDEADLYPAYTGPNLGTARADAAPAGDLQLEESSLIGGLALLQFYFQLHAGPIKGPQVIEFLRHLQRHIPGKLLILWMGRHSPKSARARLRGQHPGALGRRAPAGVCPGTQSSRVYVGPI